MEDIGKLKRILKDHEKRISKLEASKKTIPTKDVDIGGIKVLTELLKDSFFNQPRKYGQIIKQLKTNATFSSKISYKTGLKRLVKEKKISRKMIEHQWMYFKNTNQT